MDPMRSSMHSYLVAASSMRSFPVFCALPLQLAQWCCCPLSCTGAGRCRGQHNGKDLARPPSPPGPPPIPLSFSPFLLSLPPLPLTSPACYLSSLPSLPRAICWLCVCHGVGGLITQGQVGKWREAGDTHISYSVQRPGPKALGREMHGIQRLDGGEGE